MRKRNDVHSRSVEAVIIFTTTPTKADAKRIAKKLVAKRLAACTSILPAVESVFRWEEKITTESESLVMVKTRRSLFEAVAGEIDKLHPYEVPEIIAVTVSEGSSKYLKWIRENTGKRR